MNASSASKAIARTALAVLLALAFALAGIQAPARAFADALSARPAGLAGAGPTSAPALSVTEARQDGFQQPRPPVVEAARQDLGDGAAPGVDTPSPDAPAVRADGVPLVEPGRGPPVPPGRPWASPRVATGPPRA